MNASNNSPLDIFAERLALRNFPRGRIDPEAIAIKQGIDFTYTSLPEAVDGFVTDESGRLAITMNERRAPRGSPRSRFTLAHEIGHCFQSEPVGSARIPGDGSPRTTGERASDRFAAHLLMPEPTFRDLAASLPAFDLRGVTMVAAHLGTSVTATAYRAMELDLFPAPAAVLRWNLLGERHGRRLSSHTRMRGRDYIRLADIPAPGTVTARVLDQFRAGLHRGAAHVMDWFTDLDGYGIGHQIELSEEVMSLGQYGWLTLIRPFRP